MDQRAAPEYVQPCAARRPGTLTSAPHEGGSDGDEHDRNLTPNGSGQSRRVPCDAIRPESRAQDHGQREVERAPRAQPPAISVLDGNRVGDRDAVARRPPRSIELASLCLRAVFHCREHSPLSHRSHACRRESSRALDALVQIRAPHQTPGDVGGLQRGALGRRMRGEIAGHRD